MGSRLHSFRLHPLSLAELGFGSGALNTLLKFGGFPAPYFTRDETEHRLWQRDRLTRVVREDLRDLEQVREISLLEQLVDLLPSRVGSPLSVRNLSQDLEVDHKTMEIQSCSILPNGRAFRSSSRFTWGIRTFSVGRSRFCRFARSARSSGYRSSVHTKRGFGSAKRQAPSPPYCATRSCVTEGGSRPFAAGLPSVKGQDLAMPDGEQLRAFANRRWDLVADEKVSFVAERYRAGGSKASRMAAGRLARRWARLHPGGPSAEAREDDLEHHIVLKQKLDCAVHVLGRR